MHLNDGVILWRWKKWVKIAGKGMSWRLLHQRRDRFSATIMDLG